MSHAERAWGPPAARPGATNRPATPSRQRPPRLAWALALVGLLPGLVGLAPRPAAAQFGQNKVQYRSFDWQVLETEHFSLHYYARERAAAFEAARMAERGYAYLSEFFDHEFEEKIPVILYSSHQDFEQSNVIGGFIGEGTGGVTESLKGRVTLPLTGSYAELNHVLTHELVHAFQFDMMKRNFLGQLGIGPMPLWMIEGMAEWVSNGMDPVTSMWVLDAQRADKIPSVEKMSRVQDIRVYRMGQALYEVIGRNFGPERVRRIFKNPNRRAPRDSSFAPPSPPSAFGTRIAANQPGAFGSGTAERQSLETLWKAYADSLARTLGAGLVPPDSVAEAIARGEKYGRSYHLAPAVSPDGKRVLFYSSRGFSNELFLAEHTPKGWKTRSLVAGEKTPELESLPLLSASADWSPDGNDVVFVATRQGQDVLQIFDVRKGRIRRTIETELLSIGNPSYAPDGRHVVFSALQGGEEDLFVVDIESGRLVRLTQDPYSERTPRFSPDGRFLIFATDRGPQTDVDGLVYGPWNLARMRLRIDADGAIDGGTVDLVLDSPANDFAPVWSPDGSQVAFVSDRTGTHQVHTYTFATRETRRRTAFLSGVAGIVPTGPAISWSSRGDVVYSVFFNGGWHLYRTRGFPLDEPGDADPVAMQLTRSAPPEIHEEVEPRLEARERDYSSRLTPEFATVGALYIGNAGAAGSGALLLGDMLGNQYLYIAGNLRSEFDRSEILAQYANIGHRWQWGFSAYQFRDDYLVVTADNQADFESLVRRGVGAQLHYPFNRFRRIEFNVDLQTLNQETARLLFEDAGVFSSGETSDRFYFAIPEVALVHDNASYAFFTPVDGGRWRASLDYAFGDIEYTLGILDFRRYFNIQRRGALALRLLTAGSWGTDQRRLRIGGPDTFRGADFGELEGTQLGVANLELRFPIIPSTDLIRGVTFFDAAATWGDGVLRHGRPLRGGSVDLDKLTLNDIETAVGFGVRGFVGLPLRYDAALPQNGENWQHFFSIGFDF